MDGAWGEKRYSSYSFSTSVLEKVEWPASLPGRALHQQKEPPGTHRTEGWETSWLIALMMEAVQSSETLLNSYQSTRPYNPEDSHLHIHRRENLKSYKEATRKLAYNELEKAARPWYTLEFVQCERCNLETWESNSNTSKLSATTRFACTIDTDVWIHDVMLRIRPALPMSPSPWLGPNRTKSWRPQFKRLHNSGEMRRKRQVHMEMRPCKCYANLISLDL
jgi:hypothetical protein